MEGSLLILTWLTTVFWTVDIFMNFSTAIYSHGELEFRIAAIAKNYFRTWFIPDSTIVLTDIVSMSLLASARSSGSADSDSQKNLKMLRFAKLGRLLRILGVFRLLKFVKVLFSAIRGMSD